MRIRAAVLAEFGAPLNVTEVDLGEPEAGEVLPRLLITGRRVCGSSFGGFTGRDQVPEFVQLYLDGQLDVDPFVSRRIALDEVNDAFESMERQEGIRSVITF